MSEDVAVADRDIWARLIAASDDTFVVYDSHLRYVAVNPAGAALCGRRPDELIGKTRREIFGPNDPLEDQLRSALAGYASARVRHEATTPSGLKLFETIYQAIRDERGEIAYVFGLSREVDTAGATLGDEAIYDELNLVSELLRSHTENSPLGVIQWDAQRRVAYWSRRAEEIFGWSFAQTAGRTFEELALAHPDDAPGINDSVERVWAGDQRSSIVLSRNVTNAGGTVFCRWFNSIVDVGGAASVLSLIEDISPSIAAKAALDESELRYRSLFEQNPNSVIAVDIDGIITSANECAGALFGEECRGIVGAHYTRWSDPEAATALAAAFDCALRGEPQKHESTIVRVDGRRRDVAITIVPIVQDETVTGAYIAAGDITERKAAERALATQSERIRRLYLVAAGNESPERQIAASLSLGCELLGFEVGAVFDASAAGRIEFEETAGPDAPIRLAAGMCRLPLNAGEVVAIGDQAEEKFAALNDPGPNPIRAYVGTSIDVLGARYGSLNFGSTKPRTEPFSATDRDLLQLMGALIAGALERRHSRAHLKALAYYDALSGLPNRVLFRERVMAALEAAQDDGRRIAIFFLDLDRFKDINDTLGHALGDRLLAIVAKRLLGCVRPRDTVARMGGDEFTILLTDISGSQSIIEVGERILQAIDAPISIGGVEHYITTSIGIAVYPTDGRDVDTLVKNADIAMYRSKDLGRNTYQFFTPGLHAAMTARISQERSLHTALERGEFRIYYQAQIDVATGGLAGVEALVRWQHPRLGLVPPNTFIPSAELSGLIVPLGEWILAASCSQVCRWQREAYPGLRLSVNLSARQFHHAGLASRIVNILGQSGLEPTSLEVEITESVAMHDAAHSIDIMRELKEAGVRLSVDDFGTGYSSLAYLRRFPLNTLKIDKSFVTELLDHPDDMTIVRTVIAMAHSLGLDVVAEGVETQGQFDFLRREGCDRVQGFLFGPALSPEDFERYLSGLAPRALEHALVEPVEKRR